MLTMNGNKTIKDIMHLRNWSQARLADEIGKKQTNISGYLNRVKNGMRIDTFIELIEAMGCEVIIQDEMGSGKKWRLTK